MDGLRATYCRITTDVSLAMHVQNGPSATFNGVGGALSASVLAFKIRDLCA